MHLEIRHISNFCPKRDAYIFYTSGSSGRPKGVVITHKGLMSLFRQQIAMFHLNQDSRFLLYLSIYFDASLSDIFTSLLSGATLVIPSQKEPMSLSISGLFRK